MIPGIDVSSHNAPGSVPWRDVRGGFAFVRATMGASGLDTAALEHLSRGSDAGCPALGVYHYLRGDRRGVDQASFFLDRVGQLEGAHGPLILAVDVEDMPAPHPPWDGVAYTSALLAFLDVVAKADRVCGVYIAPWQAAKMGLDSRVSACPLWLAHWTAVPKTPKPWADWAVWQYGVEGGLDRNRYRGSVADLRALFRVDRPEPTYDTLGGVVRAVQAAEGRGPGGVEDFRNTFEGPVIDA